ncbi:ketoacyl-ACP synthase III [Allokutzneria sp. A3M-2-11 16]|uniref:beta-ketoacyl-ACP synthase III n=1 Tax=Allokutzneria sp. A3M-2-11 16 TaxID=2962043 RepID=UPI0020B68D4A|nr:beta-ketoacyl-ACP synthase III [Allokutzneria sp. A3M-2-11 16]MCP3804804.1 ketoacyl-ACP synthase III [Allokutzneria sp. A3M-2-11 16]
MAGIGRHVPPTVLTNADLCQRFDTSDEWIRARTGIRSRHVVRLDEATSDLAVHAASAALRSADATAGSSEASADVDLVVLATATPDHPCPATAPLIAARLGLGAVPAFDVGAVCSGFVYGLAVADGMIRNGVARRVLLIGADAFTTLLNPADRSAAVVFGDAAAALVLRAGRADEPGAVQSLALGSDGRLAELISIPAGGSRAPRGEPEDRWIAMQGQAVYRHAVERMGEVALTALERAGWSVDDVDKFVAHQANQRILDTVAGKLGLPADRVYSNVAERGNTVAASIPLALDEADESGELRAGDRVLLSAFGAGATWGAATLTWPRLGR